MGIEILQSRYEMCGKSDAMPLKTILLSIMIRSGYSHTIMSRLSLPGSRRLRNKIVTGARLTSSALKIQHYGGVGYELSGISWVFSSSSSMPLPVLYSINDYPAMGEGRRRHTRSSY